MSWHTARMCLAARSRWVAAALGAREVGSAARLAAPHAALAAVVRSRRRRRLQPPHAPLPIARQGGCRTLSGTSVASPVAAGCAALLASTVPEGRRWPLLNPASMKQALIEGAQRLPKLNIHEQGHGLVDLAASQAVLASYQPRASLAPAKLDFTDCPYMWPYCRQPVYAFGMPLAFNATVLNGMAATGEFAGPPEFVPSDAGGRLLAVSFAHSEVLWPWSGALAVFVEVRARLSGAWERPAALKPPNPAASTLRAAPRGRALSAHAPAPASPPPPRPPVPPQRPLPRPP